MWQTGRGVRLRGGGCFFLPDTAHMNPVG